MLSLLKAWAELVTGSHTPQFFQFGGDQLEHHVGHCLCDRVPILLLFAVALQFSQPALEARQLNMMIAVVDLRRLQRQRLAVEMVVFSFPKSPLSQRRRARIG